MKELFASADSGITGLLFFFGFFALVTLWTFRSSAKKAYKQHAHIPLEESE